MTGTTIEDIESLTNGSVCLLSELLLVVNAYNMFPSKILKDTKVSLNYNLHGEIFIVAVEVK